VYVSRKQLAAAVRESQARGRISDDLARFVVLIVRGYASRYYLHDEDDVVQSCVLKVMTNLNKLDPSRNVFNYITRMAQLESNKQYRNDANHDRLLRKYHDENRT
jgi:DNA-directed RNA polymerase specialized sigma24 family protein